MKEKIKELLKKYRCYLVIDFLKYSRNIFHKISIFWKKNILFRCKKIWFVAKRRYLVNKYLKTHQIRKLQIGGGPNLLEGWLNTDFFPRHKETVILDVRKPFFFKDGTFDYIFCEHMIEHISYQEAIKMLKECFRILKTGGKVRISTPDIEVYVGLFTPQKSKMQEQHLDWISNNWLQRQGIYSRNGTFVLNLMMHGWGHKFLYDFKTLEYALKETGFNDIAQVSTKVSDDENLRDIERHGDSIKNIKDIKKHFDSIIDNEMNKFGSLTVEAMKK